MKTIFISLSICVSSLLNAQFQSTDINIHGGIIRYELNASDSPTFNNGSSSFGVSIEHYVSDKISLRTGMNYDVKKLLTEFDPKYDHWYLKDKEYLETKSFVLPFLFNYDFFVRSNNRLSISSGFTLSKVLKAESTKIYMDGRIITDSEIDNYPDQFYFLQAGIEYSRYILDKLYLKISSQYFFNLTENSRYFLADYNSIFSYGFSCGLGYKFLVRK